MNPEPIELRAGPLRMRLADGELRYIKLGDIDIVRRLYFGVRTGSWDTVSPQFDEYEVKQNADSFSVTLVALCKGLEGVSYAWQGQIEGRADGSITFHARGRTGAAMKSNRIGLCCLFGTPNVCGKSYEVVPSDGGAPRKTGFPEPVNAPLMFEPEFSQIAFEREKGLIVTVSLTGSPGTKFSMEDQRNFGDSSFKAYAPLPYSYPDARFGEGYEETVTIKVVGATAKPVAKAVPTLSFGGEATGRFPKLIAPSADGRSFFDVNHDRDKTRAGVAVAFPFTPHVHLFDDDTAWENLAALPEQVASTRKIAPGKQIDVSSVTLGTGNPRPTPDPRKASPFGAAWLAAFLGEAALANVRSVGAPQPGTGYSDRVVKELSSLAGQSVAPAKLAASDLTPVVSGFQVGEVRVVVNRTAVRQKVELAGLGNRSMASVELDGSSAPSELGRINKFPGDVAGKKSIVLAPFEVRFLTPTR